MQRVFLLALVIFNVVAKMYNFWICICCSSIVLTRQSLAKPLLAGERPPLLPLSWTFRSGNAGGFILHLSTAYVRFYFALVEPRHLRRGCSSFSIRSEMPQPATPTMHQYFVKASSSQLPMPSGTDHVSRMHALQLDSPPGTDSVSGKHAFEHVYPQILWHEIEDPRHGTIILSTHEEQDQPLK